MATDRQMAIDIATRKLRAALATCAEYFDARADVVDGDYAQPAPNREMQILTEIKQALGERP